LRANLWQGVVSEHSKGRGERGEQRLSPINTPEREELFEGKDTTGAGQTNASWTLEQGFQPSTRDALQQKGDKNCTNFTKELRSHAKGLR